MNDVAQPIGRRFLTLENGFKKKYLVRKSAFRLDGARVFGLIGGADLG